MGLSARAEIVVKLTGDRKLARTLEGLARKSQRSIASKALNRGMRVIATAQKAAAPTPKLRKTIRTKNKQQNGIQQAKVGTNVGKMVMPQAHLLILGTDDRYTGGRTRKTKRFGARFKASGFRRAFRGRVKPDDFVKQATEQSLSEAVATMGREAWKEIKAEGRK